MVDLHIHLPFILGFKDVNKMNLIMSAYLTWLTSMFILGRCNELNKTNLIRPAYSDMLDLQIHLGLQGAQQDIFDDTGLFLTFIGLQRAQ